MLRTLTTIVVLGALAGCGGDDSGIKGKYSEQCSKDSDCESGLECLNRLCTLRCADHTQCQAHSPNGACTFNICYDVCQTTFNCPNGLTCTQAGSMQGTCRVQ